MKGTVKTIPSPRRRTVSRWSAGHTRQLAQDFPGSGIPAVPFLPFSFGIDNVIRLGALSSRPCCKACWYAPVFVSGS